MSYTCIPIYTLVQLQSSVLLGWSVLKHAIFFTSFYVLSPQNLNFSKYTANKPAWFIQFIVCGKKDQGFKIEHVKIHSQAKQSWFCWLERVRSLWSVCNWVLLLTPVVAGQPGSSKVLPSKSQVYSYFGTVQCKDSLCGYTCAELFLSDLSIWT